MIKDIQKKIFGSFSDREIKKVLPLVEEINKQEKKLQKLSDVELRAKTDEFKNKISNGASLDSLLVEAFAVCREAGARVLNMRHFDVQMIGGIALHRGMIAEMKTGEGKTLVATLPCYLNGLSDKGVHVITVNDYLAKRDAEWMGQVHRFLGLEVGCLTNELESYQIRKKQYDAAITYGTNNEFGFDYLRDNMKPALEHYVQRDVNFAIVDEVDSILIDEARTPLIISGPSQENVDQYLKADKAVRLLKKDIDYSFDEKGHSVSLTEDGVLKTEEALKVDNLFAIDNIDLVHFVHASLKAHVIYKKDVNYVSRNGEIIIVDEFTGRLKQGSRWSDGIHQAVEAKEGVDIQAENQTLATITLQNYFRMYNKLAGMTGTAVTEEEEFSKVYGLKVFEIPTNKPVIRDDSNDLVYRNEAGKFRAVIDDIKKQHEAGRPTLVGTTNVSKSERISKLLNRQNIPHNVLNAKHHQSEAGIIASAGGPGAVTIATNMAGRGTDIHLGDGVIANGGLHVIGTERHESRRIDNQLRGRSGRQGDPGSSQFYLSLEDDLLRIFAGDTMINIMDKIGMEEDTPISDRLVSRTIAKAQKRVELHHFDQREHILKYDDVFNKQREVIYSMRRQILEGKNLRTLVIDLSKELTENITASFCYSQTGASTWDWEGLDEAIKESFGLDIITEMRPQEGQNKALTIQKLNSNIAEKVEIFYKAKADSIGDEIMNDVEKFYLIQSLDQNWKDHLFALDKLREGIHLRGYAQKDPLLEYRKEAFEMFKLLDKSIKQNALSRIFKVQIQSKEEQEAMEARERAEQAQQEAQMNLSSSSNSQSTPNETAAPAAGGLDQALNLLKKYEQQKMDQLQTASTSSNQENVQQRQETTAPVTRAEPKLKRNDPCYCGSGKKYKHCHG